MNLEEFISNKEKVEQFRCKLSQTSQGNVVDYNEEEQDICDYLLDVAKKLASNIIAIFNIIIDALRIALAKITEEDLIALLNEERNNKNK